MATGPADVTIYCETMYGLGIGMCQGKLVDHGHGPLSITQNGPYAKFIPPRKKNERTLIACETSYLLILRGNGYPDPPDPFIVRPGSPFITGRSPSGGDAVFDKVYVFNTESLTAFDHAYQAAFDAFIDTYSDRFLADYRKLKTPEPVAEEGSSQWQDQIERTSHPSLETASDLPLEEDTEFDIDDLQDSRKRTLAQKVLRPGQAAFREKIMRAYEGRCAITGCNVADTLEAAHIIPYWGPESDHVRNGILLRVDLHALFDASLLSIDPQTLTVRLAPSISGGYYKIIENRAIRLPKLESLHPDREALIRRHEEFVSINTGR